MRVVGKMPNPAAQQQRLCHQFLLLLAQIPCMMERNRALVVLALQGCLCGQVNCADSIFLEMMSQTDILRLTSLCESDSLT
jgi:hypothetical protein